MGSRVNENGNYNKQGNKKVVIDGIKLDSKLEARYYEKLKMDKQLGIIRDFEVKPVVVLQDGFIDFFGKKQKQITHVIDFKIILNDGTVQYVDTKGQIKPDAKLKYKMFLYKYPNTSYIWVDYITKYGGWIDKFELEAIRRKNRKEKKNA